MNINTKKPRRRPSVKSKSVDQEVLELNTDKVRNGKLLITRRHLIYGAIGASALLAGGAAVKFVGDNSAGMEVYGDMAHAHLPNSNINISIGTKYRVLEINNFELHGYKPDIMCDDNQDAFQVALNDYHKQQIIL